MRPLKMGASSIEKMQCKGQLTVFCARKYHVTRVCVMVYVIRESCKTVDFACKLGRVSTATQNTLVRPMAYFNSVA